MHDIKFIRQNPDAFDAALARRNLPAQATEILKLDEVYRTSLTELQTLQNRRNSLAKEIGMAKAKKEDASALMDEAKGVNAQIEQMEKTESPANKLLEALPNIPADDVPEGGDEKSNKEVRAWGKKPEFSFKPKEHFELGEKFGMMDFETAAKISGARFVILKGALARMERALTSFFLDHNVAAGYIECVPPFLVRDTAFYGTGQLPKFESDLFFTRKDWKDILQASKEEQKERLQDEFEAKKAGKDIYRLGLIPTAEVPLTNMVADSVLDEEKLPLRFTAYTPCFRSEAGAAGKDTRGMIRQHQFSKVELVSITGPEQSKAEHERMTAQAESLLQKLGLPYRTMLLCTGDMGFSSEKTYDIEVWLPGQGAYREISSCSNCGAFQARRMKARFKPKAGKGNEFVHTLNGSGLPIGRTIVAILENYQQADGSIVIPEALRSYMGMDKIPAFAGMTK